MRSPLAGLAAVALLACASAGREGTDHVRHYGGVGVERAVAAALAAMPDAGASVLEVRWEANRATAVVRGVAAPRDPGAPVLVLEVSISRGNGGVAVTVAAEPWEGSQDPRPAPAPPAGEAGRPCPCKEPLVPYGGGWNNLQELSQSRRMIRMLFSALELRLR